MAVSSPADILRNELERLFDLDALTGLARELLGLDPEQVGGTSGKAAFVRALVERCEREEMLEALADAVVLKDRAAAERVQPVFDGAVGEDLAPGSSVAGFRVQKKLHDEGFGSVYLGQAEGGGQVTIKLLRETRVRDRRGLQRFLLAQRALRRVEHPSVQKNLAVGVLPDGRPYLVAEYVDGQLLSARLARTGAMHLNEARPVFESVAEALDRVHAMGLAHSDLRPEHVVLVRRDGALSGVLVDWAVDRLASGHRMESDASAMLVLMGSARGIAPERVRGAPADALTDSYSFGALLYEVLSGKPVYQGGTMDMLLGHLGGAAEAPSKLAPKGWVSREVDAVVLKALSRDRGERFATAGALLTALLEAAKGKRQADISRDEFDARKAALLEGPGEDDRAMALESSGSQGIPWADVLAALKEAGDSAPDAGAKKGLWFRAARVAQMELKDLAAARDLYERITAVDEHDETARVRLGEVRRALATPEEKADLLLEEVDKETLPDKRADLLRELATVYEKELKDVDNALVALTQALCEVPGNESLAHELERLAGDDQKRWNEVLQTVSQVVSEGKEPALGARLMVRAGKWYSEKLNRADFAVACFTKALALEPGNDGALEASAAVYRKAQQWAELAVILLKRGDAQALPARARELRAEAADILESKLGDVKRAQNILEKVLDEDPAQPRAVKALQRIYLGNDDWAGMARVLEGRAGALTGAPQAEAFSELAETYEDRVKDDAKATEYFEKALGMDATLLPALKGLERLYAKREQHDKLLLVLEKQVPLAATPRQRLELHNRIALIHEEEFVAHAKAVASFEAALAIDPSNEPALGGLERLYRITQKWDELANVFESHAAIVADPKRKAELLVLRGRVLLDPLGSVDKAAEAFDKALELDPQNSLALENAARVRATRGDVRAAAEALDTLAAQAKTPTEKAEAYVRAGKILEEKGDRDGAIERYKRALDADDHNAVATTRLRELYASRGDATGAIEMLQREIEAADGMLARSRLWTDVARVYRDKLNDATKAAEAAEKAVLLDSTNEEASGLLGELRFATGDYAEAVKLLAPRAARAKDLKDGEGLRVSLAYGEALARTGDANKALDAFNTARALAPNDRGALQAVAQAAFRVQRFEQARELYKELLERFGKDMEREERAAAWHEQGLVLGSLGDGSASVRALSEAVELEGSSLKYLDSLAGAFGQQGRWDEVARVRQKRIDLSPASERFEQQLELGDLLATKVNDKARASKAYLAALESRPEDRRLLMKLMQLYSEERDFSRLVEIILRMADLVEDKSQLSRYYLTAAQLCDKELKRYDEAIDYYELALEHDPSNLRAVDGLAALRLERKDFEGLQNSYNKIFSRLPKDTARDAVARLHRAQGELYAQHLAKPTEAIVAFEKAQELDPESDVTERLAELYLKDSKTHFDKAVRSQRALLQKNPERAESLRALRKLYTEAKKPDEAWCLCQALVAQKAAEPGEENYFKKFRSDAAAPASERVSEELWLREVQHPTQDLLLTAVFATIAPAVYATRTQTLESFGITEAQRIDVARSEVAMVRALAQGLAALGLKTPPVYEQPDDDGGLSFALSNPPAFVLGKAALGNGQAQVFAFLAAHKLSFLRPGHFVRQLVPTGSGLRAWLFGAIRVVNAQFPVAPELTGAVDECSAAIKKHVTGPNLEVLTSLVSKILSGGAAIDLKRWLAALELTADRAGFLLANDLPRALAVVRATPEDQAVVPARDRQRELVLFASSEQYFTLRQRLGIAIRPAGT